MAPGAGLGSFLLLLLDAEGVLCLLCCCCSTRVEVGEKEVRTPSWWGWGSCTLLLGRGSPVFSSLCLKMCLGKGEEISAFFQHSLPVWDLVCCCIYPKGKQPSSPGCVGNGKGAEVGQDLPRQTMEPKQGIWFPL